MTHMNHSPGRAPAGRTGFALFLRTGRRVTGLASVEQKFNPWHDPRNGQFTFAGQGVRSVDGGSGGHDVGARPQSTFASFIRSGGGGTIRVGGSSAAAAVARTGSPSAPRLGPLSKTSPHHPANHSLHTVKKGESFSKIARTRKGLSVSDLAWLNGLDANKPIQPGQKLIVPHQAYLDAGRDARAKFLKLLYYRAMHGGAYPPDSANPPEITDPVNWTAEVRNGYRYLLDERLRPRAITGEVTVNPDQIRSRPEQRRAGGPFRRQDDEGGHYIARELNGPTEAFNHFAQNRNFNRSEYRKLEISWRNLVQGGHQVRVRIAPHYDGTSLRPTLITVTYWIDGRPAEQEFSNEGRR